MTPPPSQFSAQARRLREGPPALTHALLAPHVDFPARPGERDRLFVSLKTFWLFLWQILAGNLSCSATVQAALAWRAFENAAAASPNTAAYCKARARLEREALEKTARQIARNLEGKAGEGQWHARRVRMVDGTAVSMPDTPGNQKEFPQPKGQREGCGFPVMRLVVLFSMATGAIVRVAWGALSDSERTLFHQLWEELQRGDILVADRGFCGFADFWMLLERGVDCVMRKHQRRGAGQRTLKRLAKGDLLVAWTRTGACPKWIDPDAWNQMPREMTLRQIEVAVEIPGFRTQTLFLVTTLLDARRLPAAEFARLYRRRWLAELFLRDVKISMGMDVLKCKTPAMVLKEMLMFLIAYNLIRALMLQAALEHAGQTGRAPEPLTISFKRTADALRQWTPLILAARDDQKTLERMSQNLLDGIAKLIAPNRPDRNEPRAIKRRMKNYPLLNKPRREFKEIRHRNKYRAGLS